MANQITPRDRGKSAHRKLATRHLTEELAHDDFVLLTQLAMRPAAADDAFKSKLDNYASRGAPAVLLDRNKSRSYKLCPMMRCARVALAVVVILSISYVLITPDPSEDVYGVLRPNHAAMVQRVLAVSLWGSQVPVIVLFHLFTPPSCTRDLATLKLLDLISVCRC